MSTVVLESADARGPRTSRGGRRAVLTPWVLMAPALAIVLVFFGLPAMHLLRMSFNLHVPPQFYTPGFTLDHYTQALTEPLFIGAIWTTIKLSALSSFCTVILGYGFALLVWLKPGRWRLMFIGLALCPMLISEISIIFGWWMFFPKNGLLSFALTSAGLISDKISLMYTEFAAVVGIVYVTLPYCFFILLSIFDGIDKRVLEASADMGAPPLTTFYEVLLPLTRAGIVVAFAQSFVWAMGTYATPSALGPNTLWTVGFLVQEQMLTAHNWPLAAAFSMILILAVAVIMVLLRTLNAKSTEFHA